MCDQRSIVLIVMLLAALAATRPATAELISDPYVLSWADGAGAVAHQVAANTETAEVFDVAYGSWSISLVGDDLHVALTVDPMTGTGQMQPSFGVGDLDWSPIPGTITGLVRDPVSPGYIFST